MKVYLDNCCFNRPYDDQSNIINRMESDAKLFIQEQIKNSNIDLVWSSVNEFENNDNPSFEKRERIAVWKQIASEHCNLNETILDKALELEKFDYTIWQRDLYKNMPVKELYDKIKDSEKTT